MKRIILAVVVLALANTGWSYTNRFSQCDLPFDGNLNAIQVGDRIVTQDAASTPKVSPYTVGASTATGFTIPNDRTNGFGTAFVFKADADLRYGLNSTLDGAAADQGYMKADANVDTVVPCATGDMIYLLKDTAGTATVYFFFETLRSSNL